MSGRGLWRHRCHHYGRPRAYSPSGPDRLWRCPVCGDEWQLRIWLGGLLRLWTPLREEDSGTGRSRCPQPEWWRHGYREEAEAEACPHPRVGEIRETGQRGTARQRGILLSRCRRCGRVVDWKRVEA